MKRKVYRRYKTRKKGGQHYHVGRKNYGSRYIHGKKVFELWNQLQDKDGDKQHITITDKTGVIPKESIIHKKGITSILDDPIGARGAVTFELNNKFYTWEVQEDQLESGKLRPLSYVYQSDSKEEAKKTHQYVINKIKVARK